MLRHQEYRISQSGGDKWDNDAVIIKMGKMFQCHFADHESDMKSW
jgi:hypothetical protein